MVWGAWGGQAAGEYISGYLIEKSLSVDNVFVWALIMSYFAVPREYQFRVLFWGVFGALVLRFVFIFAGVALLEQFEWMLFVFGGFLHLHRHPAPAARRRGDPPGEQPGAQGSCAGSCRPPASTTARRCSSRRPASGWPRRCSPCSIVIETSDVIFAIDSIPAILAVSREQFILFSSNAFAILGLRALYFLLADLRDKFDYLQTGLAVILAFVGFKMIISEWYHIPTFLSLLVIAVVLTVSIVASIKLDRPGDHDPRGPRRALRRRPQEAVRGRRPRRRGR